MTKTDALVKIIFAVDSCWRRNPPRYIKAELKDIKKAIVILDVDQKSIYDALEITTEI